MGSLGGVRSRASAGWDSAVFGGQWIMVPAPLSVRRLAATTFVVAGIDNKVGSSRTRSQRPSNAGRLRRSSRTGWRPSVLRLIPPRGRCGPP